MKTLSSACLVVLLGASCVVRVPVDEQYGEEAEEQAPPAPQVEVVTPSPGPTHVWVAGRWGWRGRAWVWLPGSWVVGRSNHHWVAGHWAHRGRRHVWVEGRWVRR